MKKYTVALAVLLACSCVRGAEETTTVEVEEGTVVVKTSTGEVPVKTGETVVVNGTKVNMPTPDFDALVMQLGADEFEKRDAATAALVEAGRVALPALKKALASDDPEVRLRVSALINRIEPRLGLEPAASQPDAPVHAVRPGIRVFRDRAAFLAEVNNQGDVRVNDRVARPEAGNPKGTAASSTRITVDGKTFEVSGDGGNVSVNSKDGQITIQCDALTLIGDTSVLKSGDKTYDISASNNVSITVRGEIVEVKAGAVRVNARETAKTPGKQETP